MKKRVDITKSVMEKVTRYERDRSSGWLFRFRLVLGALLGLTALVLWGVVKQLQESNSLDLLTLFWEDAEIIREFWQDTISVFFEELPRQSTMIALVVLAGLAVWLWWTKKKRKITQRRLTELAKRKKN